jgi:hypothetical protein
MKQKRLLIYTLLPFLLVSCTSTKPSFGIAYSPSDQEKTLSSDESSLEPQKRIVIYNADMDIIVSVSDSATVRLTEITNLYGGYIQSLSNKKAIIRIKSDQLNNTIADISKIGKVKRKIVSGNDVTEQYLDLQIRLDNAYNARKKYTELLDKSTSVEAALKVEKELERLNVEIDALEGKLKRLDHLSEFSTITVYISETIKPGILGYIGIGLYESVKWLFVRN